MALIKRIQIKAYYTDQSDATENHFNCVALTNKANSIDTNYLI